MPVPSGFHHVLTKQYGDYMTPVQGGSYHGGYWKVDTTTSYEEFIPELKRYYSSLMRERRLSRIKLLMKKVLHRS